MTLNSISLSKPLTFTELTEDNACELCRCYKNSPYRISDYSIGIKTMWESVLHPAFVIEHCCLLVKTVIEGKTAFDYPLPLDRTADVDAALLSLNDYCRDRYLPFVLQNVPKEELPRVTSLFPRTEITYSRQYSDYLYDTSSLTQMTGRSYAAVRNHIKRFHTRCPDAVFTAFTKNDRNDILRFLDRFASGAEGKGESAMTELAFARGMIEHVGGSCYACGGFVLDGEILSFCLAERCGDMLINHVEKALTEFEGIYPATVQAFLAHFGADTPYYNREDDAASRGLRMSKLQYRPASIIHKYQIHVRNELSQLSTPPTLFSERLSYSAITPKDIPSYHSLCLDLERNRYWGYDYRCDCEHPEEDYFYHDQKADFENRQLLSLAIRLNGQFIGEGVLHNFDARGSAEVGIRLLPQYDGCGYGREALRTLIHYGLYTLGLDAVHAKCYRENRASASMLGAVMRYEHEDETYFHYRSTF